jgi:SAM-dependent methyltransferase
MTDPAVAWASPPVDEIGYIPSATLLALSDEELIELVVQFEEARYQGWRNWNGNWRRVLKLDETHDKKVLDWGCGVGIEALQYARSGNRISVTDIVPDNVRLALRVISVMGYAATLVKSYSPFEQHDVIHCAGVLHHVPNPVDVMVEFHQHLYADGEVRLMLYSDWAWMKHVGDDPPSDTPAHPAFHDFVTAMDAVGDYADWYDADKIERLFGAWFQLENFEYLTQDLTYCGAVLVKK